MYDKKTKIAEKELKDFVRQTSRRQSLFFALMLTLFFGMGATVAGLATVNIIDSIGYESVSDLFKFAEQDPVTAQFERFEVVDVENGTDAGGSTCPAGTDYCYYVDMDNYNYVMIQAQLDCVGGTVTLTVECAICPDDAAPASCAYYEDVTNDVFGAASLQAAAGSANDTWTDNNGKLAGCKYLMLRVEAATGGNTGDWKLDVSRGNQR